MGVKEYALALLVWLALCSSMMWVLCSEARAQPHTLTYSTTTVMVFGDKLLCDLFAKHIKKEKNIAGPLKCEPLAEYKPVEPKPNEKPKGLKWARSR